MRNCHNVSPNGWLETAIGFETDSDIPNNVFRKRRRFNEKPNLIRFEPIDF